MWVLQISHATQVEPRSKCRLVVTANFYTKQRPAKQIHKLLDGEVSVSSTVWPNDIYSLNKRNVKKAVALLKDDLAGRDISLLLWHGTNCSVVGSESPMFQRHRQRNENFFVWNDSKIITFYCNNLVDTPKQAVLLRLNTVSDVYVD